MASNPRRQPLRQPKQNFPHPRPQILQLQKRLSPNIFIDELPLSPLPSYFDRLPAELYPQITNYLSLPTKAKTRMTNRLISQQIELKLDDCTKDLSPPEIARWLLEHQSLIKQDISLRRSQFWKMNYSGSVAFKIGSFGKRRHISIDTSTGEMHVLKNFGEKTGISLESLDDILNVLNTYPFSYDTYDGISNWTVVKLILGNRLSCFQSFQLHTMIIHVIIRHMKDSSSSHKEVLSYYIRTLLTNLAYDRLITDLGKHFDIDVIVNRKWSQASIETKGTKSIDKDINSNDFYFWLTSWLLNSSPEDMSF